MIIFEEFRDEHLKEVTEIYNYYVINSTATFNTNMLSTEQMKEIVYFDNPRYKSFAIRDNGLICGYCILAQFKKREAYNRTAEATIYLRHDYIGKGIGKLALEHIESQARLNGIHVLVAVICGENERSIKLFEKCEYQKCAHFKSIGEKFGRLLDIVDYQKILD